VGLELLILLGRGAVFGLGSLGAKRIYARWRRRRRARDPRTIVR
jgi:hypothetical protein